MSTDVWTSTEQGNLALIQAVKKHPCLYNNTLPEYSQKDVTSAAWQEIAEQFGCSVVACKNKWNGLRSSFSRELRSKRKKVPYYYAKHLSFLLPYLQRNSEPYIPIDKPKEEQKETILGLPYVTENNDLTCPKPLEEPLVQINKENTLCNLPINGTLPTISNYCLLQIPQLFVIQGEPTEKIADPKIGIDTQLSFDKTSQKAENSVSQSNLPCDVPLKKLRPIRAKDVNNLTVDPTIIQCVKANENEDTSLDRGNKVWNSYKAKDEEKTNREKSHMGNLEYRRQFIFSLMPEVELMTEAQFFRFKRKIFQLIDSLSES